MKVKDSVALEVVGEGEGEVEQIGPVNKVVQQ